MPCSWWRAGPRRTLAVLALSAVAASGCGAAGATPTVPPVSSPTPGPTAPDTTPRGGSMTIGLAADLATWDPGEVSSTAPAGPGDPLDAVYGALVYTDIHGVVQPGMAKSLTTADAIAWTLKLRDGVKFTDGTDYTAAAVKYNWDRIADPAQDEPSQEFAASFGTAVVDRTTLAITLPAKDADFAAEVAERIAWIASPTALNAAQKHSDVKPVGAGPFRLVSWNPGVQETLVRNDAYWDRPRPYLDGLRFVTAADPAARQAAVVAGQAQISDGYLYQFGTAATAPGVTTRDTSVEGLNIAWLNTATGIMSDVRARQAVVAGVNRDRWILAQTVDPSVKAPPSLYPASWALSDASLSLPRFDAARAQSLIDALATAGRKFTLTIVAPHTPEAERGANWLQQTLTAFRGVAATVRLVPPATWQDACQKQSSYDICIAPETITFDGPEPSTHDLLASGGPLNLSRYSSGAMDADLAAAAGATTGADRIAAYRGIQQQFLDDLPFVPYGLQHRYLLLRLDVGGVVNAGQGQVQPQFLYYCPGTCPGEPAR